MRLREFLEEKKKLVKGTLTDLYEGMSKPLIIINSATIILFAALIFSIPAISFISGLHYITWGLTILVIGLIALSFFFGNKIRIDFISIMFFAFCISALISCAMTKFVTINITYFLLTIFLIVIYTYAKSNPNIKKMLLMGIFIGSIIFVVYYCLHYRGQLFSFGKERLGDDFGDVNDISIFNGVGFSFAIYYVFFAKKIVYKVINAILLPIYLLAIFSSGSKIAYFFLFVVLFACIFFKLGKKRWWISLLIVVGIIGLFIALLQLPALSSIKERALSMLSSFFKIDTDKVVKKDYSTSNRLTMLIIGMEMFMRRPLFGYGVNGFQYFGGFSNGTSWSHNHISEMLSGTGIIGFLLYNFPIFYSLYRGIKDKKYLPCILIIFYIVTMISIALPGEKLFAYPIGIILSSAYEPKDLFHVEVNCFDIIFKRKEAVTSD